MSSHAHGGADMKWAVVWVVLGVFVVAALVALWIAFGGAPDYQPPLSSGACSPPVTMPATTCPPEGR